MKMSCFSILLFTVMLSTPAPLRSGQQQAALLRLDATVQHVAGAQITIELKLPEFSTGATKFMTEIATQAIRKSLFLEGDTTELNGIPAKVTMAGNALIHLEFEKSPPFPAGTPVKILVPKKTLAVLDFEVIGGDQEKSGRATLEGLTSALIDSGYFAVVERSQLKALLGEQALSLTGATREPSGKLIGQLLTADLILTGTLEAVSANTWDINLSLVNVRTGQSVGAIAVRRALFKPQELRDTGPLADDL